MTSAGARPAAQIPWNDILVAFGTLNLPSLTLRWILILHQIVYGSEVESPGILRDFNELATTTIDTIGVDFPIPRHAVLRAQANPQRFPEIWAFESEISLGELEEYARDTPQELADAIRRCGQNVFKTYKSESVIVW